MRLVVLLDPLRQSLVYLAPANQFLVLALDCISDTLFKLTMLSVSSLAFIWPNGLPLAKSTISIVTRGCEGGREHPKSGIFVKVYLRMIRLGSGLLLKTFQVGPKLDSQPSCL